MTHSERPFINDHTSFFRALLRRVVSVKLAHNLLPRLIEDTASEVTPPAVARAVVESSVRGKRRWQWLGEVLQSRAVGL